MERLGAVALILCGCAGASATNGGVRPLTSDEAAVIVAVLKRGSADPTTIPDGQLLKMGRVLRTEVGYSGSSKLSQDLIAPVPGWTLRSLALLQQDADSRDGTIYFVVIESVDVTGSTAVIEWGTDIAFPTRLNAVKVCCTLATDEYRKTDGAWLFHNRVREVMF